MPTNRSNAQGFAVIEAIILVVVVSLLGFAAWRVLGAQQPAVTSDSSRASQSAGADTTTANQEPAIQSASDLTTVEAKLDNAQIDDSSLNDLDAALDF